MSALRNRSFKPMLEALEDRCLLSAAPLTVQSAEAAVEQFLQDVQQQLTALQVTAGDVILAAQQDGFATMAAASPPAPPPLNSSQVYLQPSTVNPSQNVPVRLGAVVYPIGYQLGKVQAVAFYRWDNGPVIQDPFPPNNQITFNLEGSKFGPAWGQSSLSAPANTFFPKTPGPHNLQVTVAFFIGGAPLSSSSDTTTIRITSGQNGNPLGADEQQDLTAGDTILDLLGALVVEADSLTTALAFSGG